MNKELHPKEWQFALSVVEDCLSNGFSSAQIISDLASSLQKAFGFTPEHARTIADHLTPSLLAYLEDSKISPPAGALIVRADYDYLLANTPFLTETDTNVQKLILALLVSYVANYHSSGWIRYNRKEIFYLAGLSKLPVSTQESLTQRLHSTYNLNMRVVGSNQPIPCFRFSWSYSPFDPDDFYSLPESGFVVLPSFSPEAINTLLTHIKETKDTEKKEHK